MKLRSRFLLLGGAWVCLQFPVTVQARGPHLAGGATGGEMPSPLEDYNQKVELADGEIYFLAGKIVFFNEQPFFQVDLSIQPWLANSFRVENPYYSLEGSATLWHRYDGKKVKLLCQADGQIVNVQGLGLKYMISLRQVAAY